MSEKEQFVQNYLCSVRVQKVGLSRVPSKHWGAQVLVACPVPEGLGSVFISVFNPPQTGALH